MTLCKNDMCVELAWTKGWDQRVASARFRHASARTTIVAASSAKPTIGRPLPRNTTRASMPDWRTREKQEGRREAAARLLSAVSEMKPYRDGLAVITCACSYLSDPKYSLRSVKTIRHSDSGTWNWWSIISSTEAWCVAPCLHVAPSWDSHR